MPEQADNLAAAYAHCQNLANSHYENFPTASKLIRRDLRPAVAAIYAFARYADDIADEGDADDKQRLKQLDAWETLLERCQQGAVDHPVFIALADAIARHALPVQPLHDLLTAFRMDVSVHAYASVAELMFYCQHSANPVGRLVLALHGIRHPSALAASDAICSSLQLINFWQDLSIDIPRGRCYLPDEWLNLAKLDSQKVLGGQISETELQPALDQAIDHARQLMNSGRCLLAYLPWRLRLQIALTIRGGTRILDRVAASPRVLRQRPALAGAAWPGLILLAFWDSLITRTASMETA
ncbi:MAG: squalene synthase HpnC [Mariprofundaceae bacterium]